MFGTHTGYSDYLAVAAAVIRDEQGRILISLRHKHLHQGGLWEFPGGKIEPGESTVQALTRELDEELGIRLLSARPLIRIPYSYPDRKVLLDVWLVDQFGGEAHGKEGQQIRWLMPDELPGFDFPAANKPIVTAARLPDRYLITPEPEDAGGIDSFLEQFEQALASGIKLVQLRAKRLEAPVYRALAMLCSELCQRHHAALLLNAEPEMVEFCGASGLHLSSHKLNTLTERPLSERYWLAASCHNGQELMTAHALGVDFAVLSPVNPTRSHPDAEPLGWQRFKQLSDGCRIPVYALGGMAPLDLHKVWDHGGQGIAAIRSLWPDTAAKAD